MALRNSLDFNCFVIDMVILGNKTTIKEIYQSFMFQLEECHLREKWRADTQSHISNEVVMLKVKVSLYKIEVEYR